MPPIYVKPENVLKRSEELLALGTLQSQQQAFENLNEIFQSKRFKQTPIQVLEPILLKFIDLCVDLSKKSHARSGLVQYKNAAQHVSIPSIELVLKHFISRAEERLAKAEKEAAAEIAKLGVSDVDGDKEREEEDGEDELDLPLQPASMMMDSLLPTQANAAGAAGERDRIERRIVVPAQRLCWDAYDISLDIAKGNDRLEIIYQQIAHQAFAFCKTHKRKADFRRLCDQRLRKDLSNATKYGHQQHAINLSDPDTLARHLDTRFLQLETAVELELWQEAFRSVEDVHGLVGSAMVAGKKMAKPAMMANYYEKLTKIFKAEGGTGQTAVFHAAAWGRYLQYAERERERNANAKVSEKAPGCVLLSALAVPLGEGETVEGRNGQRLVALLNLPKMPTRQGLLKDMANKNILKRVSSELRELYTILEHDFQPLRACARLAPLVSSLAADVEYAPYVRALRDVVLSRLFQQLSQVYDTISLAHVLDLVKPFAGGPWETDKEALEKFLMAACRRAELVVSVDHVSQAITFQDDAFSAPPKADASTALQRPAADVVRTRLADLAIALHNTVHYLDPSLALAAAEARTAAFNAAIAAAEEERKATHARRQIVARRRELMDEANVRREKEDAANRAERARIQVEEQAKREKEQAVAYERERLQREIDNTRREEAKKLAEQLAAKGGLKVDISNIEELDTSKLVQLQVEQMAKEKSQLNERLRIVAKRVDHLERAFRKEERPLLAADYERQKVEDRKAHEAANAAAREAAIAQHKAAIELKERLGRMMPDYVSAREQVESHRKEEFTRARKAAEKKIAEEKQRFKDEVVARRKEERERRDRARQEDEEAERAEEEEAAARAEQDAKEAAALEDIERRKREADERAAALAAETKASRVKEREEAAEATRKQMAREEEVERKRNERRLGGGSASSGAPPGPRPPAAGGGYKPPGAAGYKPPGAAGAAPSAGASANGAAPAAGAPMGWREKEAARKAAAAAGGAPADAPAPAAEPASGAWRPRRGGASGAGGDRPSSGAPPGRGRF